MKKEYIAVSDRQVAEDETEFVEDFWTQHWEEKGKLPNVERVSSREECRIMQRFLRKLPPGSRILDGGCGTGAWTAFLTNQGFDVVGIDISQHTIDRLKKLFPQYRFACGDIRHTEFADASFDAYFSWGVFEHFEDGIGACISEAYRILKPGGLLLVSVPFENWWYILQDAGSFQGSSHCDGDGRPRRFYQWRFRKRELQQEMETRGFHVHQISPIHLRQGVTRWLRWNFPSLMEGKFFFSLARRLLAPAMPRAYASHMILAVAQKREGGERF